MESYVQGQIKLGHYANVSEVVRAGIQLLMERDGARQFFVLKADSEVRVELGLQSSDSAKNKWFFDQLEREKKDLETLAVH